MEFFKFSYWIKKSIIFTAPPEKLHQTVLFCLNFSHHGKSLVNPKKKWWFRITSRPPPFWQGCETQFPVCSLKAQRQTVDITIFQLQMKGFPGRALRQSHAEEWITGGVGSERREQPCAQGAQAALWRVWGEAARCLSDSHHLGHSWGLRNKLSFPACALAMAIGCLIYMRQDRKSVV